jgi:hypothetical protein
MGDLFTAAERADLFATTDLGTAADFNGVPVDGVYQHGTAEALGVIGTTPMFLCSSADVAAIANDSVVTIGAEEFTVVRLEHDGEGFAMVVLQYYSGAS